MIAEVSALLIESTLATSIAAVLVLLLRRPLRRVVGARGAYALWLLLPIAGIAVTLPARTVTLAMPEAMPVSIAPIQFVAATEVVRPFDAQPFLIALWGAGAIGLGLVLVSQQRRFRRALGRLRRRGDGIWQAERVDAGPAVIGLWRGRIVLPSDFESRYTDLERDLVLRHERVHLARRDPLANLAAAALRCLYWFNPLLHYAVGRFRFDQELAADATVLAQRPEARRPYADAMLKAQLMFDPPPLGCHWQSAHPLKERIAMLKQPLPGAARLAAGFAFALLLSAASGYAAWASQPEQTRFVDVSMQKGSVEAHLIRNGLRIKSASYSGTIGARLGLSDAGLELKFSFTKLTPTQITIAATLKDGDTMLAQPTLVIERGTTGSFAVGKLNADGKPVLGVEFEVPPGAVSAAGATLLAQPAAQGPVALDTPNHTPVPEDSSARSRKVVANQTHAASFDAGRNRSEDGTETRSMSLAAAPESAPSAASPGAPQRAASEDGSRQHQPPRYPADALERGVGGTVVLNVKVGADGKALQSDLDTGKSSSDIDPTLVAAAQAAVLDWSFKPALDAQGRPVAGWVSVPISFKVANDERTTATTQPTYSRVVRARYPSSAKRANRGGTVLLRVLVGVDGEPQQVEVERSSGSDDLDIAAKVAVRQWTFNPANDGRKAVPAWVTVPMVFGLDARNPTQVEFDRHTLDAILVSGN